MSQPETYIVEMEYRDFGTIRDALDLAHGYLTLTRAIDKERGRPVSKRPGPLRKRITKLQNNFPRFVRHDPDPCFGIHNFVEDDPFREIVSSLVDGGYNDVPPSLGFLIEKGREALDNTEPTAHCTECHAERINPS